eukprot:COSAG06_NODE_3996_length_4677_cov_1.649410_6_plen_134_part_00
MVAAAALHRPLAGRFRRPQWRFDAAAESGSSAFPKLHNPAATQKRRYRILKREFGGAIRRRGNECHAKRSKNGCSRERQPDLQPVAVTRLGLFRRRLRQVFRPFELLIGRHGGTALKLDSELLQFLSGLATAA